MKPAPFEYRAPTTLAEAIGLLAGDPDAKPIAGGQSLMPLLNFRLAMPSMLVDLRVVPGLEGIAIGADGVRLGAKVRWCDIEADTRLAAAHPLLHASVRHVAHYQIRNRGTVGGSLAHADPAAELPGIAVACDGELRVTGSAGERTIPAGEFFVGPLQTTLRRGELIAELRLPYWPATRRWAFREFARREGDFALSGVALFYDEEADGRARNTHAAVIGACTRPHRLPAVEAVIDGRVVDAAVAADAAKAATAAVDPPNDLHADPEYRRALTGTLVERALRDAAGRSG